MVNLVMLWFFVGAGASLSWHARMLDEETLRQCAFAALTGSDRPGRASDPHEARFTGPETGRFVTRVASYDDDTSGEVEVECRLGIAEDADLTDPLLIERAEVVGR